MAPTSSLQPIGWPASFRTFAAASRALSFLTPPPSSPAFAPWRGPGVFAFAAVAGSAQAAAAGAAGGGRGGGGGGGGRAPPAGAPGGAAGGGGGAGAGPPAVASDGWPAAGRATSATPGVEATAVAARGGGSVSWAAADASGV